MDFVIDACESCQQCTDIVTSADSKIKISTRISEDGHELDLPMLQQCDVKGWNASSDITAVVVGCEQVFEFPRHVNTIMRSSRYR
jgi:hypothetical protein